MERHNAAGGVGMAGMMDTSQVRKPSSAGASGWTIRKKCKYEKDSDDVM